MKCKGCEYPLWDMAARVCPECGRGFSPLDYTFVINSVRFMCPHCRQDYYGTGEGGHLVPQRFACVKCGAQIDEAEMVLLPTEGVSEVQTLGGVVPWRVRTRNVFWRFFATVGMSAFGPNRLARFAGDEVRPNEAGLFGSIALGLYVLMCVGWCGIFFGFSQTSRLGMQAQFSDVARAAGWMALWVLGPVVGGAALMAMWAGVAQLVLQTGNPRPAPWGKTLECFGYAIGAGFLMAVPCMGIYMVPLAVVWVAVSVIIQLHVRHGVSGGRATLAGLLFPGIAAALLVGGIAWSVSRF